MLAHAWMLLWETRQLLLSLHLYLLQVARCRMSSMSLDGRLVSCVMLSRQLRRSVW